jgi:hypothetical protein
MNEPEEQPAIRSNPPQTGVSGVLSLFLPIFGFGIAFLAAVSGRRSYEGMRDLISRFAVWSLFSLVGAISAIVSFRHHGFSATSFIGLVLCSAPFLCLSTSSPLTRNDRHA